MVTKGIITSIDFNGNTCQVRIPLFETAGNDPIISTAVVSNTPGSYNGYKVDDVVLVAFEDGKMETPVVIGKLYLGTEKEKADPRGSLNTESLVAAKTAAVPADTKLTTNTDKNLPNTMNPYANLSSIANNLNKLNTDVNYLDVFTNNQFSSVITDINKQGEELRFEIKQTASNIEAKVDKEHDGTTTGLGWNLTDTKWTIDATNTAWSPNKLTLFEVDRNGQVIINGNVRIGGYPQSRTRFYKKLAAGSESPAAPEPNTTTEELPDEGWHETYEWENNYHIWETIQTIAYDTNDNGELQQLKITYSTPVDITGATGASGMPATTYWAKLSTTVHTGKNQKSDIEITPYAKTGSSQEVVDTTAYFNYSLDNGANWKNADWTSVASLQDNKIIILANNIRADNIIVKLAHAYTDSNDSTKLIYNEYETETITYSPLNTPIIDLTNDTDVIKYKPDGNKITADVSSTAQVYLGGSPEVASYDWAVTSGNATISKSNSNQTVTVTSITGDKAIITCTATTTNFKDKNGKAVQISKDFVVSREVVVASYWLSFSPVHTGTLQQTDIEVRALAKIGNDGEGPDENAYLRYKWDNESNWSDWNKNATLIIPKADIQNNNLRIQATHDSTGTDRQVYEDETITYSPLNTPVLDLTNDNDAIAYDGNTILGNSVSSTAVVYLNGSVISGCTFAWTATNCTISGATDSNTVTVSAIDDNKSEGTATCKVTSIPNYQGTELVKVFTVAKQYKGNHGADGQPGVYIKEVKQWYILWPADAAATDKPSKPGSAEQPEPENPENTAERKVWMSTPPEAVNGYVVWTCHESIFSDDTTENRHIEYSDPVKDNAYALAQGKTTNYYSPTKPINNIKKGDCWFDTGYVNVRVLKNKTEYLGKFIISADGNISVNQDEHDADRYIPVKSSSTKLIKITPENIDTLINNKTIVVGTTEAFETGNLKQWDGKAWKDIAGELVTNKLTANYINALDITTKKIHVNDTNGNTLFKANGIPGEEDSNQVTIGGFSVTKDALVGGKINTQNYCKLNILDTFKVGETNNKISSSSLVIEDPTWAQKCCDYYKDTAGKSGEITWKEAAYDAAAGTTQSQQCLYNGLTTYKCNSDNALKNEEAGNPIISCMVLKPNKELIESKIKEALNIKDGEPIPTVTFSTTLNLGISSPSYIDSTINNNYDYIIASTPFSLADLGIEIGPDVTDKDQFIQDKIVEAIKKIVDSNVDECKHKLSTGIFTGDGKIQEYARATGPRSIGSLENLTKVIYPSLTTDHYIAIFMVNIQKTCFKVADDIPIYDYDSSGNITGFSNKTTDSTGSNYILPTYGYCCVPNSVEVALQTLEIGTNFKVKTDGTIFANNAFFTGTLNVPETSVIGGFNISKNTLTSSTLNIDSNKVTISSFKPLVLGSNFKLISTPDTVSTIDASGEETTQKLWKSKISSRNPLEILGESSILLSNTIASEPDNNASISLESAEKTTANTASQEIRVVTTPGTGFRPGFDFNAHPTHPFNTYVTNNNIHFDNLIGTGGAVPINYFTRATITATVYSSSATNAEEKAAEEAYKITVYYKFGTTWSSTTLAIPKGKTSASTTVSRSGTSTYPTYYGISKNSSSEAVIAGADDKPPLKYTVYYTNSDISYTPKITANGALTVKGNTTTTGALTVKNDIKTTSGNVYGNAFYANSDRELKTNIENINLDSNLDKFYQQLQPVKFNFKTDLNAKHFGFIAQDLKDVLSIISTDNAAYSIVNKDDKTGYYRVNYNEMVALNAAQIKNIMNYIKDLQSQYEALKLKYKELEEKINENS